MAPDLNNSKSKNDSFDINALAELNEDITPEFIEQLQMQVAGVAKKFNDGVSDSVSGSLDVNMFEEVQAPPLVKTTKEQTQPQEKSTDEKANENNGQPKNIDTTVSEIINDKPQAEKDIEKSDNKNTASTDLNNNIDDNASKDMSEPQNAEATAESNNQNIENLTNGNITERDIQQSQIEYNNSLNFVDDNINYSKYIIYISPENTEFIDSLTVKERKNLINNVLSEQGKIVLNRRKNEFLKTLIVNLFIAIITIAVMIPVIYKIFNFSLETTIDNYRRSQSNFQTLYKEHGKIKPLK